MARFLTRATQHYFLGLGGQSVALGSWSGAVPSMSLPPHVVLRDLIDLRPILVESYGPDVGMVHEMGDRDSGVAIAKRAESGVDIVTYKANRLPQWMAAMAELRGPITDIAWVHGEADAQDEAKSLAYEAEVLGMLGTIEATYPAVRVHITDNGPEWTFAWRANIAAAKASIVASDARYFAVSTADLTYHDGVHTDQPGTLEMGHRIGASMLSAGATATP